jgi:hypothetical protein
LKEAKVEERRCQREAGEHVVEPDNSVLGIDDSVVGFIVNVVGPEVAVVGIDTTRMLVPTLYKTINNT